MSSDQLFSDIDAFLRHPRLTAVAAGPEGRVVAQVAEADEHGSKLLSALWELDPAGQQPARRLTFSATGESNPDRKSTRLNSSHVAISYAVFCLKKKKTS